MELLAPTCVVRSYDPGDAKSLAAEGNNRKIWLNLRDRFPHPFTEADASAYIASVLARPNHTSFAIAVDGQAVGGISLRLGEDIERFSAELGYWLGESYWGRGITSDAVEVVTRHGLSSLSLARIFALPFAHNPASHRVLEKSGYEREGLLRCSAVKDGRLLDQVLYAAVASKHRAPTAHQ
jgi:ribosomal-protein-alanine N-acetyltransferase